MIRHCKPLPEVEFAVNVGFLTKALWKDLFFQGGLRWQQKRWKQLQTEGVFRSRPEWPDLYLPNGDHPMVRAVGPYLAKPPVLNQILHDELVARSYYLLSRSFPRATVKTEALLKREMPLRNRGVRIEDSKKHPDLVVSIGPERIAIEVELNQKSRARYEAILRTYRHAKYTKVLYVVGSDAMRLAILGAANDVKFPYSETPLGFGSVANWKVSPPRTPFKFSEKQIPLNELVPSIL